MREAGRRLPLEIRATTEGDDQRTSLWLQDPPGFLNEEELDVFCSGETPEICSLRKPFVLNLFCFLTSVSAAQ